MAGHGGEGGQDGSNYVVAVLHIEMDVTDGSWGSVLNLSAWHHNYGSKVP